MPTMLQSNQISDEGSFFVEILQIIKLDPVMISTFCIVMEIMDLRNDQQWSPNITNIDNQYYMPLL